MSGLELVSIQGCGDRSALENCMGTNVELGVQKGWRAELAAGVRDSAGEGLQPQGKTAGQLTGETTGKDLTVRGKSSWQGAMEIGLVTLSPPPPSATLQVGLIKAITLM